MSDEHDVWRGEIRTEYEQRSGVAIVTISAPGAELKLTYSDAKTASALAMRCGDIIGDATTKLAAGEGDKLALTGWFNGDELEFPA